MIQTPVTSIYHCAPILDFSVSVLVDFSYVNHLELYLANRKCASLCVLPYKEVISWVSTVSDNKNSAEVDIAPASGKVNRP